jgi:hypothetical protein
VKLETPRTVVASHKDMKELEMVVEEAIQYQLIQLVKGQEGIEE